MTSLLAGEGEGEGEGIRQEICWCLFEPIQSGWERACDYCRVKRNFLADLPVSPWVRRDPSVLLNFLPDVCGIGGSRDGNLRSSQF
jgi:hypothetical protein